MCVRFEACIWWKLKQTWAKKFVAQFVHGGDTHFDRGVRVSFKSRGSKLRLFVGSDGQTPGPRNFSGFFPARLKNRRKYIWKMCAEKDNGGREDV